MSTRGLIGIKQKNGSIRYIYNHSDSYPSYLMLQIADELQQKHYNTFKQALETGEWTNTDITNITEVDYLFHEYVYILDFDKKIWSAYKTNYKTKKLIPIVTNLKFTDKIIITEDNKVIKIQKLIKQTPNYQIIYSGRMYYLIDKQQNILCQSTKETDILSKWVSMKL